MMHRTVKVELVHPDQNTGSGNLNVQSFTSTFEVAMAPPVSLRAAAECPGNKLDGFGDCCQSGGDCKSCPTHAPCAHLNVGDMSCVPKTYASSSRLRRHFVQTQYRLKLQG